MLTWKLSQPKCFWYNFFVTDRVLSVNTSNITNVIMSHVRAITNICDNIVLRLLYTSGAIFNAYIFKIQFCVSISSAGITVLHVYKMYVLFHCSIEKGTFFSAWYSTIHCCCWVLLHAVLQIPSFIEMQKDHKQSWPWDKPQYLTIVGNELSWDEKRGYQRDVAYLSSIDQSGVGIGRLLTE